MNPAHPATVKYRALDHWRGIAALAVMVFPGFGGVREGRVDSTPFAGQLLL